MHPMRLKLSATGGSPAARKVPSVAGNGRSGAGSGQSPVRWAAASQSPGAGPCPGRKAEFGAPLAELTAQGGLGQGRERACRGVEPAQRTRRGSGSGKRPAWHEQGRGRHDPAGHLQRLGAVTACKRPGVSHQCVRAARGIGGIPQQIAHAGPHDLAQQVRGGERVATYGRWADGRLREVEMVGAQGQSGRSLSRASGKTPGARPSLSELTKLPSSPASQPPRTAPTTPAPACLHAATPICPAEPGPSSGGAMQKSVVGWQVFILSS